MVATSLLRVSVVTWIYECDVCHFYMCTDFDKGYISDRGVGASVWVKD